MNSKEALERINNILLRHYDYLDIEVIKQDLDRLEMLEKDIITTYEFNKKLREKNSKLKTAIEILNRFVSLTKVKNEKTNKWEEHSMYSFGLSKKITQQEYDLLEEFLDNE